MLGGRYSKLHHHVDCYIRISYLPVQRAGCRSAVPVFSRSSGPPGFDAALSGPRGRQHPKMAHHRQDAVYADSDRDLVEAQGLAGGAGRHGGWRRCGGRSGACRTPRIAEIYYVFGTCARRGQGPFSEPGKQRLRSRRSGKITRPVDEAVDVDHRDGEQRACEALDPLDPQHAPDDLDAVDLVTMDDRGHEDTGGPAGGRATPGPG
jgi:hypothetical protein